MSLTEDRHHYLPGDRVEMMVNDGIVVCGIVLAIRGDGLVLVQWDRLPAGLAYYYRPNSLSYERPAH